LAEYAILSYAGGINLTVSLASTNLDYQKTFELLRDNQKVLHMAVVCVPRVGGKCACQQRGWQGLTRGFSLSRYR
jgi:hypothetical protein